MWGFAAWSVFLTKQFYNDATVNKISMLIVKGNVFGGGYLAFLSLLKTFFRATCDESLSRDYSFQCWNNPATASSVKLYYNKQYLLQSFYAYVLAG